MMMVTRQHDEFFQEMHSLTQHYYQRWLILLMFVTRQFTGQFLPIDFRLEKIYVYLICS